MLKPQTVYTLSINCHHFVTFFGIGHNVVALAVGAKKKNSEIKLRNLQINSGTVCQTDVGVM
jgi:hypothetical protein